MPSRRAALDLGHAAPYDITLTPKRRHRYGKAAQNSHVRLCKPFYAAAQTRHAQTLRRSESIG